MEKKFKVTKALLGERNFYCDTFGKNKAGNFVVRHSFFYRMGNSSDKIAAQLQAALPEIEIVNHGEVYKAFRGGASVANQSHWWVEFRLRPVPEPLPKYIEPADPTLNGIVS